MTTRHQIISPPALADPVGYAHAVVASPGNLVFLGGQVALDDGGRIVGESLVDQFDRAAANVVHILEAAGGTPEDLVSFMIYVTDTDEYHAWRHDLARVYRQHFGRHYVASGVFGVHALFHADAKVELVCTAVVPAPA